MYLSYHVFLSLDMNIMLLNSCPQKLPALYRVNIKAIRRPKYDQCFVPDYVYHVAKVLALYKFCQHILADK
jgi:hypothetical protein